MRRRRRAGPTGPVPDSYAALKIACGIRCIRRVGKAVAYRVQQRDGVLLRLAARKLFVQRREVPRRRGKPWVARETPEPILERVLNERGVVLDDVWMNAAVMQIVFERKNLVPNAERAEMFAAEILVCRREVRNGNGTA